MEYRLLGPLEVRAGGCTVPVPGAKPRALLAVLLLHANEAVSVARLMDALWPDRRPQSAENLLQVYVSRLRKALGGDCVRRRPPGYTIVVADDELDLIRFERLAEE